MVIVAVLGDLGSGKTTNAVRIVKLTKQMHPEKTIYSNIHLNNLSYKPLDLMELYLNQPDEKNIIIFGDEFYNMMDSRISSSYRNIIESYYVAMSRKAKADFILTMQYEKFVDCRLAPFVKVKYIMEGIPVNYFFYMAGKKYSYIRYHPFMFKMNIFDERSGKLVVTEKIFNGSRWFKEFDSYKIVLPPKDVIQNVKLKQLEKEVKYKKLQLVNKQLDDGTYQNNKKKR